MTDPGTGRTVRATGTGAATAVPDAATVQLAVTHRADHLAAALAGVESARAEVVAVAHGHVPPRAVGSTGLSLWPEHDESGRVVGHSARHGLRITCPGLGAAGALVAALAGTAAGRLVVEAVTPEVADPAPAQDEARAAAFAEARRRAAQLARLAGGELGEVLHVVDGSASDGPGARMALKAAEAHLEPGETTVRAVVTVEFALR